MTMDRAENVSENKATSEAKLHTNDNKRAFAPTTAAQMIGKVAYP